MLWTFLSAVAATLAPVEATDLRCHGGAQIFFEPGSAEIDRAGTQRLEGFVSYWREHGPPGFVRIESGGDGLDDAFDRRLSRRRSEAIRDFLAKHGHRSRETIVVVGETFGLAGEPEYDGFQRMGWVAQQIPADEYARLYPPNLVVECF